MPRLMLRPLLGLALTWLLAASAAAQSSWYVDPTNGSDAMNGGTGPSDAFQSITFALANPTLASGDTIVLAGGVYNDPTGLDGSGNQLEAFPLSVPNGVSLVADSVFSQPVIDGATTGGNIGQLLALAEDISASTQISGVTFQACGAAISSNPANSLRGVVIEDCTFRTYTGAAVDLPLRGGRVDDSVLIRDCTFTGQAGSTAGVRLIVSDNSRLDGGGIEGCTISGSGVSIWIQADTFGAIDRDFLITRNTVSSFTSAGVLLWATVGDATNTATVRGNIILGDDLIGTIDIGIWLFAANTLGAGSPSLVDGLVSFNDVSRCNINMQLETTGLTAGSTRIEAVFAGNLIRNALTYGVRFLSAINDGGMSPDFGGKVGGSANAGRNTFENATATWEIGLDPEGDISGPIAMSENFWIEGLNPQSRTEIFGPVNYPTFLPLLSNVLAGSLSRAVIQTGQAEVLTIRLTNGRFVVQVDETFVPDVNAGIGSFGQYKTFEISGPDGITQINPVDLQLVAVDGTELSFNVPSLSAGNYTIRFTNPGFQSLLALGLRVTDGGGGGGGDGGGGCVVATAAHGNYHAPEVRILRQFRDRYLLPRAAGRDMVRAYYHHGGPVAVWIAEREWAKKGTRAALAVPTGVAWSLLNWNPGQRLLMGVLLLGLGFWLLRRPS